PGAPWRGGAGATGSPSGGGARSGLCRTAGSSSATSSVGVGSSGSGMPDLLDRQVDAERRPRARRARPADVPAVLLDDLTRDGEPEAGALGFRREELLEEAPPDPGRACGPR